MHIHREVSVEAHIIVQAFIPAPTLLTITSIVEAELTLGCRRLTCG